MKTIYDEASGYWTGKPWLVLKDDGEPAIESFKTEQEAADFIDTEMAEACIEAFKPLADCTCQTEQYVFGGKVHRWQDDTCPVHGIRQDIDPTTGKPWRSIQCKRNGHRPTYNNRQGYSECAECGEVLPANKP